MGDIIPRMPRARTRPALFAVALFATTAPAISAEPWPTAGWRTATPESQGLDSAVLAEMLDHARSRGLPIHSVLIVRNGQLVLDAPFYPYEPGYLHDVASVTKSVTSLLVGIALDKRYLKSVDQPVVSLLPAAAPAILDPRKRQITLEHLLTMTSGLDCGFGGGEPELAAMRRSEDWAAFALSMPMRATPGAQFAYCSPNNHLLSSILSATTGESLLSFARQHLFGPLGIREAVWPADAKGRTHGWGDLHLHPRDLAKIAYLYLRGGRWEGRQIVSEQWVRQSIAPRVTIRDGQAYGYSWWINTSRQPHIFEAIGRGGQRAAVLPDKDVVVVFNGGGLNTDDLAPFLFRAIRSDAPLPENAGRAARLRGAIDAARQAPAAASPSPPPSLAASLSGKRYVLEPNPLGLETFALRFENATEARVAMRMLGHDWSAPVGLDARPRLAHTGMSGLPVATKGEWLSERAFLLDLDTVAGVNHFLFRLEFDGDRIHVTVDEVTGEVKGLAVRGRLDTAVP
jgi:CubicO group peptidase (beta-lactamase class C family)